MSYLLCSNLERDPYVAHLTATLSIGGIAALGGLCQEPFTVLAQLKKLTACAHSIEIVVGGFSCNSGTLMAIGKRYRRDWHWAGFSRTRWFLALMSWVTTSTVNIHMAIWASADNENPVTMVATLKTGRAFGVKANRAIFGRNCETSMAAALVRFRNFSQGSAGDN